MSVNSPQSGGAMLITPRQSKRWEHAMKPDIGSESRFMPTLPAFDAPVRGSRQNIVWCGKSRLVWLPDDEKNLKIHSFVLTEFTNTTDGHTNRRTPHDGRGAGIILHQFGRVGFLRRTNKLMHQLANLRQRHSRRVTMAPPFTASAVQFTKLVAWISLMNEWKSFVNSFVSQQQKLEMIYSKTR